MLLQQIVETLDAELHRLYQLRVIVSGLDTSTEIEASVPELLLEEPAPEEIPSRAQPIADAGSPHRKPRAISRSREKKTQTADGAKVTRNGAAKAKTTKGPALSGTIPAGPVVISAAAVAREKATRKELQAALKQLPAAPQGTLGSMIRALRLDSL